MSFRSPPLGEKLEADVFCRRLWELDMIQKVAKKANLSGFSEVRDNLSYWLTKRPAERVAAVEFLRRQ